MALWVDLGAPVTTAPALTAARQVVVASGARLGDAAGLENRLRLPFTATDARFALPSIGWSRSARSGTSRRTCRRAAHGRDPDPLEKSYARMCGLLVRSAHRPSTSSRMDARVVH